MGATSLDSSASRQAEARVAAALALLGAWTIVVPYLAVPLGLEVKVESIVEVVDHVVPGLLVAAPVLAAGLVALRRSCLRPLGAGLAFTTFAVFALLVAATQYARGGSGEWGGRYFALGLPVLVPVALLALAEAGARLDAVTRRAAAGGWRCARWR